MAMPETVYDEGQTLSDRELLDRLARQVDHLDVMVHEIHGFIAENRPHLERFLPLLDPGAKIRAVMGLKPKAKADV